MADVLTSVDNLSLAKDFFDARSLTDSLSAPLSAEDQTVQSMPDASPTKWHRAHTSWFFETFLLGPGLRGYEPFHPAYEYLFNSYYQGVGTPYPRHERGLLSRPGIDEIAEYRAHVDASMGRLLQRPLDTATSELIELGIQHEHQHQELLLMDIKDVLWRNPLHPAYAPLSAPPAREHTALPPAGWREHPGGILEIGHEGAGFSFDNECPRHAVLLQPFAMADRPVTCGEWLEFIADGGYDRPELWLSDGWATVRSQHWEAPQYWTRVDDQWHIFTLGGTRSVDAAEPVCHISYYEADAYARWAGGREGGGGWAAGGREAGAREGGVRQASAREGGVRLPTEAEWEAVASTGSDQGHFLDLQVLHPKPVAGLGGSGGSVGLPGSGGSVGWRDRGDRRGCHPMGP